VRKMTEVSAACEPTVRLQQCRAYRSSSRLQVVSPQALKEVCQVCCTVSVLSDTISLTMSIPGSARVAIAAALRGSICGVYRGQGRGY
jgi:hypothetical protein